MWTDRIILTGTSTELKASRIEVTGGLSSPHQLISRVKRNFLSRILSGVKYIPICTIELRLYCHILRLFQKKFAGLYKAPHYPTFRIQTIRDQYQVNRFHVHKSGDSFFTKFDIPTAEKTQEKKMLATKTLVGRTPVMASGRLQHFSRMMASASKVEEEDDVRFKVSGAARIVSLNRARKLNALNASMCEKIIPRLVEFNRSKVADLIILKSLSPRAFCSGGDVIQCAKDNMANESQKAVNLFHKEYSLDYLLAVYGKPIVSLVNGIAMGGGVGLAVHGPFRVVCETTRIAMPETRIGFFDDVGTSFWLPKLDGNLGYYLSLTGDDLRGIDTLLCGFGTHYVPYDRFDDLVERLSSLQVKKLATGENDTVFYNKHQYYSLVNEAIEEFTSEIPTHHQFKYTPEQLNTIEKCFNPDTHESVPKIIEDLIADGSEFAISTAKKLEAKSPISLAVNWSLMLKNRKRTIYESLNNELKVAAKMMTDYKPNDFTTSVNARLIKKIPDTTNIKYKYPDLKSVPASVVDNLTSNEIFNPDLSSGENLEDKVAQLQNLNISQFTSCPALIRNYQNYPYSMGLPTEDQVKSYVKTSAGISGLGPSFSETLEHFQDEFKDRAGVTYKVKSILNRKTKHGSATDKALHWIE